MIQVVQLRSGRVVDDCLTVDVADGDLVPCARLRDGQRPDQGEVRLAQQLVGLRIDDLAGPSGVVGVAGGLKIPRRLSPAAAQESDPDRRGAALPRIDGAAGDGGNAVAPRQLRGEVADVLR